MLPRPPVADTLRAMAAEAVGTFALVFAGTAAVVVDDTLGGITHLGVAAAFGLAVAAMIYAVGDVSGAHLNPAVTVGFAVAGRFPWRSVLPYAAAQVAGAFAASSLLRVAFPEHGTLAATLPTGPPLRAFAFETALTLVLMFVILRVSTGAKEKGITAGVAIGAVVGLEALVAGPVCGASMNPARSLAPAVVSGHTEHLWVYLAAPVLGAVLAVGVDRLVAARHSPVHHTVGETNSHPLSSESSR